MNKLNLIWIFALIILVLPMGVNANLTEVWGHWSLDNDNVNGNNIWNLKNPTYNLTKYAGTLGVNGILEEGYLAASGGVRSAGAGWLAGEGDYYTLNVWINSTGDSTRNTEETAVWICKGDDWQHGGGFWFESGVMRYQTQPVNSQWCSVVPAGDKAYLGTTYLTDGQFHMLTGVWNKTVGAKFYIDGIYIGESTGPSCTMTNTFFSDGGVIQIGDNAIGTYQDPWEGTLDEFTIFSSSLSGPANNCTSEPDNNICTLFNEGVGIEYPFSPPVTPTNLTLETVLVAEQSNPVILNNSNYQNIISSTFSTSINGSMYGGFQIEVEGLTGASTREVTCRFTVDGTDYDTEKSRTLDAGTVGNLLLYSTIFNVTKGVNYDLALECRRSSGNGLIGIDKAYGIGHFLIDSRGNEINHINDNITFSFDGSANQDIVSTSITTANTPTKALQTRLLVVDAEIGYNYISSGDIEIHMQINGETSEDILRSGSVGSLGSGSYSWLVANVSNATTVTTKFIGEGSNGDQVDIKYVIKEYIINERGYNVTSLSGETFSATGWTNIISYDIENIDVPNANIVTKASISTTTASVDKDAAYRIIINSSTSNSYSRTISVGDYGVTSLQFTEGELPFGNYTVTLQAQSSGGTITIDGGYLLSYLAGEAPITTNEYNVTANNFNTGYPISLFNVTNDQDTTFMSVGGVAIVTAASDFENLTISSYGYLSEPISEHNTSLNLQVNLTPFYLQLINLTPANNTQYNTSDITFEIDLLFNGTGQTTCNLTIDGIDTYIDSTTSNDYITFSTPQVLSDGVYNYSWSCYNDFDSFITNSTLFYVDTVFPTIATTLVNNTIYVTDNVTASFNFTDETIIFSWNISLNGAELDGATNVGETSVNYNLSFSPNLMLTKVPNNLTIRVADGHTAARLAATYLVEDGKSILRVGATKIGEDIDIPILSKDNIYVGKYVNKVIPVEDMFPFLQSNLHHIEIKSTVTNTKDKFIVEEKLDRLSYTYIPDKPSNIYSFKITSDKKIYIIRKPDSKYQEWLVIEDKWLDFIVENEPNLKIEIERVDDYNVIATISDIKKINEVKLQSIGELNIRQTTYLLYRVINDSLTYETTSPEISYTQTSLLVNHSDSLNFSIEYVYNNTVYPESGMTITSTTGGNLYNLSAITPYVTSTSSIKSYWNYTATSLANSVSNILYTNQTVTPLTLNTCGSGVPGINFTVTEVTTGDPINDTTDSGDFTLWTDVGLSPSNLNIVKNFALTWTTSTDENTFYLCVNDNDTNYVSWTLVYETNTGSFSTGQSIVLPTSPQSISNITSYIFNLPLISSAGSVVMNIIDNFGTNLISYYVNMWLVRPGFNDTISTSFVTDFKGEWMVSYNPSSVYRFDIYNPDQATLVFTTNNTQVTSNPFVIQIPESESVLESLQSVTTMKIDVTCVKLTQTCSYIWDDILVESAYFEVLRVNGWGSTLLYNETTHSTAGTMSYTVTENMSNNLYRAVAYIDTTTTNSFYVVGRAEMLANNPFFNNLGNLSTIILTGFFIVLTLAMLLIDLGPIGITVGILLGLLVGFFIGIIPLTIAGIIAFAIILIVGLLYGKG